MKLRCKDFIVAADGQLYYQGSTHDQSAQVMWPSHECHRYCCRCSSHVSFAEPGWHPIDRNMVPMQREYDLPYELEAINARLPILDRREWQATALSALSHSVASSYDTSDVISQLVGRAGTSSLAPQQAEHSAASDKVMELPVSLAKRERDIPKKYRAYGKAWQWRVRFQDQCGGATELYTHDVVLTRPEERPCCLPGQCRNDGEWCLPGDCIDGPNLCTVEDQAGHADLVHRIALLMAVVFVIVLAFVIVLVIHWYSRKPNQDDKTIELAGEAIREYNDAIVQRRSQAEQGNDKLKYAIVQRRSHAKQGNYNLIHGIVQDAKLMENLKSGGLKCGQWTWCARIFFIITWTNCIASIALSIFLSSVDLTRMLVERSKNYAHNQIEYAITENSPACQMALGPAPSGWHLVTKAKFTVSASICSWEKNFARGALKTFLIDLPTLIDQAAKQVEHWIITWVLTHLGVSREKQIELEPHVDYGLVILNFVLSYAVPIFTMALAFRWADQSSLASHVEKGNCKPPFVVKVGIDEGCCGGSANPYQRVEDSLSA